MRYIFTFFVLLLICNPSLSVAGTFPADTVKSSKYTLSSRNDAAQVGKYKKVNVNVVFDEVSKQYVLNLESDKPINAYLEVSDQDENVIYFKPVSFKGRTQITLTTEDGPQLLFKLAFSEPASTHQPTYIIRAYEEIAALSEIATIR